MKEQIKTILVCHLRGFFIGVALTLIGVGFALQPHISFRIVAGNEPVAEANAMADSKALAKMLPAQVTPPHKTVESSVTGGIHLPLPKPKPPIEPISEEREMVQ